ncbi:protein translocase subunit SecD [bacterium]|nr:protein translocase subunit SecD [bacterium]
MGKSKFCEQVDFSNPSYTMVSMFKERIVALLILIIGAAIGWFVYASELPREDKPARFPFKLGLDLSGGTQLVYRADTSAVPPVEVEDSMSALRDVIERRVNLFGVVEPLVQTEKGSFVSEGVRENRLLVELPGVTDIDEAVRLIGQTPLLEFKTEVALAPEERVKITEASERAQAAITAGEEPSPEDMALLGREPYMPTELTGKYLKRAELQFGSGQGGYGLNEPIVSLVFTKEGADIFERLTKENVGRTIAIYLDGVPISTPVVNEAITGGEAVISGDFTPDEARELVRNLNFGALPLPIELIGSESIGASLGEEATAAGIRAGAFGFFLIALFMVLWYRLPGLVAVAALALYVLMMLAIIKLVPVTLTAAGIAGFILSVGMAVDANILVFERFKEELKRGKNTRDALHDGFSRAWTSIRDSNTSSFISAIILFWFGTSLIEGFALMLGVGVLVSILSAITITRTFLRAALWNKQEIPFLFGSGIRRI